MLDHLRNNALNRRVPPGKWAVGRRLDLQKLIWLAIAAVEAACKATNTGCRSSHVSVTCAAKSKNEPHMRMHWKTKLWGAVAACTIICAPIADAAHGEAAAALSKPLLIGIAGSQNAIGVLPAASVPGIQRVIVTQGCIGLGVIDESQLASGRLIVRAPAGLSFCGAGPQRTFYTPRGIGSVQVVLLDQEGVYLGESRIDTLLPAHSQVNINGMWFDPETNGSGISFHHSQTSDGVFGTWFLFSAGGNGGPRWLSLQSVRWMNAGITATGLAVDARPTGAACATGDDCPRAAGSPVVQGSISLQVIDANNLFIQGHDSLGRLAFTSYLRRLAF
jgi:hypothetical protein